MKRGNREERIHFLAVWSVLWDNFAAKLVSLPAEEQLLKEHVRAIGADTLEILSVTSIFRSNNLFIIS